MSPLTVRREPLAVTETSIATKVHQTLDALLHLSASVTLNLEPTLDGVAQGFDVGVTEIVHLLVGGNASLLTDLLSGGCAHAVDVRKRINNLLTPGEIDTCNTCHNSTLTLTLLVARVVTDHPNNTLSTDYLALLTNILTLGRTFMVFFRVLEDSLGWVHSVI
jgi:hypothetical protein